MQARRPMRELALAASPTQSRCLEGDGDGLDFEHPHGRLCNPLRIDRRCVAFAGDHVVALARTIRVIRLDRQSHPPGRRSF